mmetsp:Transcript_8910/g.40191  ORF Transcript_8910/g.40191 Transcript_8910/m.40191 type:complete len:217 (+) Transcript_8910:243-893(+)
MENTIGDAPSEWYREEEHIGYDVDGRRILKRRWNDSIENLLHTIDDPSYWRKVFDEKEDREISLSRAHLELIQRLRNGAFPNKSSNGDMRQEQNHEVAEVAWSTNHEPKRRFVPSKWEAKLVLRVIRTLRAHATLNAPQSKNLEQKMIWDAENTFQSSTPGGYLGLLSYIKQFQLKIQTCFQLTHTCPPKKPKSQIMWTHTILRSNIKSVMRVPRK